eukprot:Gb_09127 [translate_table: standard]
MLVQSHTVVNVHFLNTAKYHICHAISFNIYELRGEKGFWCLKTFSANFYHPSIWQRVVLYQDCCFQSQLVLTFVIRTNITKLLLNFPDSLKICTSI